MERLSRGVSVWVACAVFLAGAMWRFGHRQMGAFDDNIIIDTAWRMFSGQRPYVDFYVPLSPEFYLGAGWAFRVWGVDWSALVRLSIVLAVFTFALQTIALRYVIPFRHAIAIALTCQMLAMMQTSYWWYNSSAAITACLLFSASLALVAAPASRIVFIIFSVALIMLTLMKVNIAAVSILAVVPPLLIRRPTRNRTVAAVAASACAVLAILQAARLNPLDILQAYLSMAGTRGVPTIHNILRGKPNEIFVALPVVMACAAAFLAALTQIFRVPSGRRPPELAAVLFIVSTAMLVGIYSILMSTEQSLISGGPLIVLSASSVIAWAQARCVENRGAPVALVWGLVMSGCATLTGLLLFDLLPFDVFVGWLALQPPYVGLLMAWSFSVVMGAGAFAVSLAAPAGQMQVSRFDRLNQASRLFVLVSIAVVIAAASVGFRANTGRLATDLDPLDTQGTWFVMLAYFRLLALWAIVAAAGVAAAVAIGTAGRERIARTARWSVVLLLVIATSGAAAAYIAATRLRVRGNGVELFYSDQPYVAVDLPFFRGFHVSQSLKAVTSQIASVLSEYRALGYDTSHIFFGIRLEFAYAAFGLPSPTGLPVWWDPAAAYPVRDEPQIVERFLAHRFPLCVFYGKVPDFSEMPKGIVNELKEHYRRVPYSEVTVFIRNPGP